MNLTPQEPKSTNLPSAGPTIRGPWDASNRFIASSPPSRQQHVNRRHDVVHPRPCSAARSRIKIQVKAAAASAGSSVSQPVFGPPRLVLVREPNQLGVEGAPPQPAFGARLV